MKDKPIKAPLIISALLVLIFLFFPFNQQEAQVMASGEPGFIGIPSMPGEVEGTGNYFEIKDSEYLNIILKSNKEIKIILESNPRMIRINISSSTDSTSTNLILEGLEPNKTYYKYEDSYKNEAVFVLDENGNYTWTQDLTQPHHVWFQEIRGTIFISTDTVLTSDLNDNVEITTNNITLDCNGYSIIGRGAEYSFGIYLPNKKGVTIKNCIIKDFYTGILLYRSQNNNLIDNTISSTFHGIYLGVDSSDNTLIGNNALSSSHGITLHRSHNTSLRDNSMVNNKYNFWVEGRGAYEPSDYIQNIDTSNTVDGKPIYYLVNEQNRVIDASSNAGYVGVMNSENIIVKDLTLKNNVHGLLFFNTKNSRIEDLNISDTYYAIYLQFVLNTTTTRNIISTSPCAIALTSSDHSLITENTITKGNIQMVGVSFNDVTKNTVSSGKMWISRASNNNIIGNEILNSHASGIHLRDSYNNIITENTIADSERYGIDFSYGVSSNNKIYHNNFIDNYYKPQARNLIGVGQNSFDDDYPSGGNYWSDYTVWYPDAQEIDGSGI